MSQPSPNARRRGNTFTRAVPWHEFQERSKGLSSRTGDSPGDCWL